MASDGRKTSLATNSCRHSSTPGQPIPREALYDKVIPTRTFCICRLYFWARAYVLAKSGMDLILTVVSIAARSAMTVKPGT